MAASYGCLEVITPPGADSVVWAQHVNSNGSCFLMYGGFLRKLCARNGWFVMENPIKMDDLEVSPILGNPIFHGMIWGWFPYFQTNPYSSRKISWTIMIFKYRQPLAHRVLLFWHKKNSQLSTLKLLYIRKSRHVHPLPGKSPSSLGLENCSVFFRCPNFKERHPAASRRCAAAQQCLHPSNPCVDRCRWWTPKRWDWSPQRRVEPPGDKFRWNQVDERWASVYRRFTVW